MPRIPELDLNAMPPEQRAVADEIINGPHGRIVGPYPAWLQSPELARRARSLSEFIRFKSALPGRLKELAILIAGRFWDSEFEFFAHSRLAREEGLDDETIQALAQKRTPTLASPAEELVYTVCTEMFQTHRLSDTTYARAVEELGLPALVELIATIGYYGMVSMTLNAFNIGLPEGEPSPFPAGTLPKT